MVYKFVQYDIFFYCLYIPIPYKKLEYWYTTGILIYIRKFLFYIIYCQVSCIEEIHVCSQFTNIVYC